MNQSINLHPDRLFPTDPITRQIARELYQSIKSLPIISPHGHTDPAWFASNENFTNASELLIQPDHYVFRMLYSQGISLESLGIKANTGSQKTSLIETNARKIWHVLAKNYHLYRGTPSRMWLDMVFSDVFGFTESLSANTADYYFDKINEALSTDAYKPRALFERFNIEVIATTESPLDSLKHHQRLNDMGWGKKVITTYRPDNVTDPDYENFAENLREFGELTDTDLATWQGYLNAHRIRRLYFKSLGANATDHSHPTAQTADLSFNRCEALYQRIIKGDYTKQEAELFRAQVLTEMAAMSLEDGLVMQVHCGVARNHNQPLFSLFGRDKGADMPKPMEYVEALQPLLNKYGNESDLTIILFTLDETVYTRELAPLAGHYPALRVGPPWWFHDSPEGMLRYREQITETAGFYNTVGFNDDTRAFLSIPARHDVARRMDCRYLATLISQHRLSEYDGYVLAQDLTYNLAKNAYKI